MKYSFLMPYYQRARQLKSTLRSLSYFYKGRLDFEVIIAWDMKNPVTDPILELVEKFDKGFTIRVIPAGSAECWNPTLAFNAMAKEAKGEFIVLTNPECVHRADLLAGFDQEFAQDPRVYVVCACFSLNQEELSLTEPIEKGCWFQHSKHRNAGLHFCAALHRETFRAIGGFDPVYAQGMCFEDDDFRNRLKQARVKFIFRDDLLVVHLAHPHNRPRHYLDLHAINKSHYDLTWGPDAFRAEMLPPWQEYSLRGVANL